MKITKKLALTMLSASALGSTFVSTSAVATTNLSMWYHGAGNVVEARIINQIVNDFNNSQSDWNVVLESFPQGSYNDSVIAAALANNLPDILDVDGPVMPNWAWAGYLQPLKIDKTKIADFLPGVKGYWNDKLYSVGLWDAAVALITRRSILNDIEIRVPTIDSPWSQQEFNNVLVKLKATGKYDYPLDLGLAWKGEWFPYAFSPFLQSFGGDLIDRSNYKTAEGKLNGEDAIAFGEWWQELFSKGYSPGNSQDPADRDNGLIEGKYAMQWNGNWAALNIINKFGDDVLLLPAPDFGHGSKIGAASWQLGVSSTSAHPQGASEFIEFALQDKYLAAFSDGIGVIPPTKSAAELTKNYKKGGPMAVFYDLSKAQAMVRPVTPGYIVEAKVFEKALADIADGADVEDTLDSAVDEIDADIQRNSDYSH
ncbi:sugar-binding protein [Marinomonas sp. CT5]|uniref:sugar ABC transporter substrate-binding protein n=1 Tax=Marinomonas sp. CT5 TaxID=2066133 RepID=UPI001BB0B2A0|nr:extracellular solute-binding protein [Marinomonas sp. CT5]QUX94039.1 sugar-binding protein [Marinomonas sp. CT5]